MREREEKAVSEILGAVLLLAITVSLFSLIHFIVLSTPAPQQSSSAVIAGEIIQNQVVLSHHGGKSLVLKDDTFIVQHVDKEYSQMLFEDINDNGLWDIGEHVVFQYETIIEDEVRVIVVDIDTNEVVLLGKFNPKKTTILQSNIDTITPFAINNTPLLITATNTSPVDMIELWYHFLLNNDSWSEWTLFSRDSTFEDGWSWDFSFPNGIGFYEFISIASADEFDEESPIQADTRCFYES